MYFFVLLVALVSALSPAEAKRGAGLHRQGACPRVDTVNRSLRDVYCEQPLFITFLPKTAENQLIDNICHTYFPLPDDPDTFQVYEARVYCDGSTEVVSYVATDFGRGIHRQANPFVTLNHAYFGYAGCDTYLISVCTLFGESDCSHSVIGISPLCKAIGLSCLRKVEEIISDNCLPDQEFYALPMRLPNRCVTQQQCIASTNNQFYKALGLAGPLY